MQERRMEKGVSQRDQDWAGEKSDFFSILLCEEPSDLISRYTADEEVAFRRNHERNPGRASSVPGRFPLLGDLATRSAGRIHTLRRASCLLSQLPAHFRIRDILAVTPECAIRLTHKRHPLRPIAL